MNKTCAICGKYITKNHFCKDCINNWCINGVPFWADELARLNQQYSKLERRENSHISNQSIENLTI